jgi:hypothetical protein
MGAARISEVLARTGGLPRQGVWMRQQEILDYLVL